MNSIETVKCNGVVDLSDLSDLSKETQMFKAGFYVDTNIWYKITYEANPDAPDLYPILLSGMIADARIKLLRSKLSFSELANLIDRDRWKKYLSDHPRETRWSLNRKKFRKIESERQGVIAKIDNCLKQVESYTDDVEDEFEEVLNYITEDQFMDTLADSFLDPTDALMINLVRDNGLQNIITNDGDYLSVRGIYLLTLDRKSLELAHDAGKLLSFSDFLKVTA